MAKKDIDKIKMERDLEEFLKSQEKFEYIKKNVGKEAILKDQMTLVIDIIGTLVQRLEVKTKSDLDVIMQTPDIKKHYVVVHKVFSTVELKRGLDKKICCDKKGTVNCLCRYEVFKIRPYAFQIL